MSMLIARAPVRISFAGGGTDLPIYYRQYGGLVISTSINKYFYVLINDLGVGDSQLISADYQSIFSIGEDGLSSDLIWNGDLALPKAILAHFGPRQGENIFISCEVPPGTGLGSSSAAAVGLIIGLARQRHLNLNKLEIAEMACQIEIERLQMPIGKQDQYASALGGMNQLEFTSEGVNATPLKMDEASCKALQDRLMLFFTGVSRNSTTILHEQKASIARDDQKVVENLHYIKDLAITVRGCLEQGRVEEFGALLNEGWQHKKNLSPNIANSAINQAYEAARQAGAEGGKITGAGGGGFLLLCCPPDRQAGVVKVMEAHGLKKMNFQFEEHGAHVLLDQRR
jgi:D-glycero-alpha-D-manno-heptose-7-phosphate kinase